MDYEMEEYPEDNAMEKERKGKEKTRIKSEEGECIDDSLYTITCYLASV